jgi:hypothetical protein
VRGLLVGTRSILLAARIRVVCAPVWFSFRQITPEVLGFDFARLQPGRPTQAFTLIKKRMLVSLSVRLFSTTGWSEICFGLGRARTE